MTCVYGVCCQAVGTRDAIAKCLYSALFDWIVLQVNQALVSKRDFSEHKVRNSSLEPSPLPRALMPMQHRFTIVPFL